MSILGSRLANLVLFLSACWLGAGVINEVASSILIPPPTAPTTRVETPQPSSRPWSERQAILDRNLFGAQVVKEIAVQEPEPDEDLQETRLPLKLLGTIASADQVVASAAIENTQKRSHDIVKVGDRLTHYSDVVVSRIDRARVVLQNGASREELTMDEELLAKAPSPPKPAPGSNRRRPPRRPPEDSVQARLKELTNEAGPLSATELFSQARVLPKYKDGKMVGIELSQIEADSFYEKVGLKDGDLITSLNGVSIDNPSASRELLAAFSTADELVAEVMGPGGEPRQIVVDPEQLNSIMQGAQ